MPDDTPKPMSTDQPVVGGGMPGVATPTPMSTPTPTGPNVPADQPEQINPEPTAPVTGVPVVEQPPVTGVPPAPKVEETPDTTPTV